MRRSFKNSIRFLTRGALVAALYVVLTYVSAILGISSGVIQFRISEMLCILPVFMPEAIVGLYIGCFISNMLTGCLMWDVVLGSLATLIGAVLAYLLRNVQNKWLTTLPTILANALIVPIVLITFYGSTDAYAFILFTVTLGEIVCAGIGGTILYYAIQKTRIFRYMK